MMPGCGQQLTLTDVPETKRTIAGARKQQKSRQAFLRYELHFRYRTVVQRELQGVRI